jgi:hypothetical protein
MDTDYKIEFFSNDEDKRYNWANEYVLTRLSGINGNQEYGVTVESIEFIDKIIMVSFDDSFKLNKDDKKRILERISAWTGYDVRDRKEYNKPVKFDDDDYGIDLAIAVMKNLEARKNNKK